VVQQKPQKECSAFTIGRVMPGRTGVRLAEALAAVIAAVIAVGTN
jgi:hypothetical protein